MAYIIQILLIFILLGSLLKLSFWKFRQAALFGAICAGFIVWTCQWAVLQSKTQLADFFNHTEALQNAAVLITIESALCFAFCFAELRKIFGVKREKWQNKLLYWYPGLLVFPVLFYLQTQLIFALPGTDFTLLSYLFAVLIFAALPLLSYLPKAFYREKELRLEVYFLVNLFICIIGLITTVNGNVTYLPAQTPLNINAIALSVAVFLLLFLAGIIWNKIKWKRTSDF
ncbi:MAG: hypothetical protein LBR34_09695 [Prevotella sp.]|jgi:hypothetical protein|nr:hypothetical protein [Prevotella sp.]